MYAIYFFIFLQFTAFLLSLIEERTQKYNQNMYLAFGLILILTIGLREIGIDNDSIGYEHYFMNPNNSEMEFAAEPSFIFIANFLQTFTNNVHILLLTYAAIAISIKFYGFRQLSESYFMPIVVYMGYYFVMQEMTQIRAGVSAAMILPCIFYLSEKKRLKAFLCILIAIFFHYSAIALLPMLFLNNKDLSVKWRFALASIVPISYFMYFVGGEHFLSLDIPYLGNKLQSYQILRDRGILGDTFNVFSMLFLVPVVLFFYCLFFYDTIIQKNKYLPIMLKMAACYIFIYINFSFIPVIAYRISDLYGIVNILLFTNIAYTINPKWLGKSLVYVVGAAQMLIAIFFTKLLHPSS